MEEIDIILNNPDRQAAYFDFTRLYIKSKNKVSKEMRQDWDYGEKWVFPKHYRLACRVGEKYDPKDRIIASLAYHSIENTKITHREQLIDLAIIYQSCILAELDPFIIFKHVAAVSTQNVAKRLMDFANRNEEDKCLKAFHLVVRVDEHGDKELYMT